MVGAAAVFVPLMLLADGDSLIRQCIVAAATVFFLVLLVRETKVPAKGVIAAIIIASTGEVFLSLLWGLYSYQHALIPFYVPPGHGIFYVLAAASADQPLLKKHATGFARAVLFLGTIYALYTVAAFGDWWGLLWWVGVVALITRSSSALLMSACVVYTMLLEWAGTAIGNWQWHEVVPVLGLRSANPPSGVGILYCLLDIFTVMLCVRAVTPHQRLPLEEPLIWGETRA